MKRNKFRLLGAFIFCLSFSLFFQNCSGGFSTGDQGALSSASINPHGEVTSSTPDAIACSFNGSTISSGQSTLAYQASHVAAGQSCAMQMRTCQNGNLSGSYNYSVCTVDMAANMACTFNGQSVASGSSVTAYLATSVSSGQSCASQSRACVNGSLSGSYAYGSCTVLAPTNQACSFNGQSIASGSGVTAYLADTVGFGQSCSSQIRTCDNGSLSGSYAYSSCTVAAPTVPGWFGSGNSPSCGLNSAGSNSPPVDGSTTQISGATAGWWWTDQGSMTTGIRVAEISPALCAQYCANSYTGYGPQRWCSYTDSSFTQFGVTIHSKVCLLYTTATCRNGPYNGPRISIGITLHETYGGVIP